MAPVLELAPATPDAVEVHVNIVPGTELVNEIDVDVPEQIVDAAGEATAVEPGSGLTVTVYVIAVAGQPLADPLTVYTAVPLLPPVATRESLITLPLLLLPPVTPVSTTVQLKLVPATVLLRLTDKATPAHIVGLDGLALSEGIGSTATATVIELPVQPLADGVMVYTAVPCAFPVVVNVSAIVLPLLFVAPATPFCTTVQLNCVPGTKLVSAIDVVAPEQIVSDDGVAIAKGIGFTVMVTCAQFVLLQAPSALTK